MINLKLAKKFKNFIKLLGKASFFYLVSCLREAK